MIALKFFIAHGVSFRRLLFMGLFDSSQQLLSRRFPKCNLSKLYFNWNVILRHSQADGKSAFVAQLSDWLRSTRKEAQFCVEKCPELEKQFANVKELILMYQSYGIKTKHLVKEPTLLLLSESDVLDKIFLLKVHGISEKQLSIYPALLLLSTSDLEERMSMLSSMGISKLHVSQHTFLLFLSKSDFEQKIPLLTDIGITNTTLPLLQLSTPKLKLIYKRLIVKDSSQNRIKVLAHYLFPWCTDRELGYLLVKHHRILTIKKSKFMTILKLLREFEVPIQNVKHDLYIFYTGYAETIRERLVLLQQAGITDIKPWLLRCTQTNFDKYLRKWKGSHEMLFPHSDKISFLAEQLKCSPIFIQSEIVKKFPSLLAVNLPKMKRMLDLLFANGITAAQIYNRPQIFRRSVDTIEKRLQHFSKLGYQEKPLHILDFSKTNYQKFLQSERKKMKRNSW